MILVPVKNLADAKQRLSVVLTPEERVALAQAMCEDVLQALADWTGRPSVTVVTNDSFALNLAARFNFEVVADDNSGETNAIELATAFCKERGAGSTLVVPADIPLLNGVELQKIMDHAPHQGGAVLVPDAAGRGTNAAWRSPGDLFPLRFGMTVSCLIWLRRRLRACLAWCWNCRHCARCRSSRRSSRTVGRQRKPAIAEAGKKLGACPAGLGLTWETAGTSAAPGKFGFSRFPSTEKFAPEIR